MKHEQPLLIRHMALEDCPQVHDLEAACFGERKGTIHDLETLLCSTTQAGIVAVRNGRVLGYALYTVRLRYKQVILHQIAVTHTHRRLGIGSRLIQRIIGAVPKQDTNIKIHTFSNERNLIYQLFLRANGFQYLRTLTGALTDGEDDAYLFAYPVREATESTT